MTRMRNIADLRQTPLFDPFQGLIPPLGLKQIRNGWQGVFRSTILQLLPAQELGEHFHPSNGRPTKELFSIAGLMFLQESNDWTDAQSVDAYLFRTDVQYALNLEPGIDEMCLRTFERYRDIFIDDELAAVVMDRVTTQLVEDLELKVDQQRLDSTHVYSNMASFGRTRLMGVTIKRFLTQVQRHHPDDYRALPESLRQRYAAATGKLFANEGKSVEERARTRQQVAEEMHDLIVRFADHAGVSNRSSYKALATVFEQQCKVVENKVEIRVKTGGACMQNPSDPDATYDGHKGQGFKAQLVETCSIDNEVQLIVAALPQTAAEPDADALEPILEDLKQKDRLPETMLADTAYGGDENVQMAAAEGVELVSPVAGRAPDAEAPAMAMGTAAEAAMEPLTIDDFAIDERTGKATACPTGRIPLQTIYDDKTGTTTIEMPTGTCDSCPFRKACPMQTKPGGRSTLSYTDKQQRLSGRRREEDTDAFRERYSRRSGIESTNGGLKRRLGLGQLRVRGMKAVSHAIYLKVAGWNLLRAVASGKLVGKVMAAMGRLGLAQWVLMLPRLYWARISSRSALYDQSQRFGVA
jgi:Transposase DDE domain